MTPDTTDTEQLKTQDGWPCYREHSLFESAVEEASRELEVSREMAMMCAFGAMATACQGHIDVEMPSAFGKVSPTSLMLLTIADSGERKTTTQNYFFEAINEINNKALKANDEALREHRVRHQMWAAKKRYLERMYNKYSSLGGEDAASSAKEFEEHLRDEPTPNSSAKFLYEDTTPQALIHFLHENTPVGCLLTSEANSIFNGKVLNELDKLNTLWDGGSLIVDRLSRPTITLKDARLTMSLMTQPNVISKFMGRRGDEARGTGFLARFLVAWPKSMAGNRGNSQRSEQPRKKRFNNRIREYLETPLPADRQVLMFSEHAKKQWHDCQEYLERQMQENGRYHYLKDHASKLLENTSRLAAIMHAFERTSNDDVEIDVFTLRFCWRFAQACSRHFAKNLANEPQIITDTCELANYLLRRAYNDPRNQHIPREGEPGERILRARLSLPDHLREGISTSATLTEIKQLGPNRLRGRVNAARLMAAIDLLEKLGHIRKDSGKYDFKESIISITPPKLKNGESLTITALPLFSDQEFLKYERGIFTTGIGRYCIKASK